MTVKSSSDQSVSKRADVGILAFRALIVFLAVGIIWRVIRFSLGFPVWGDEASLLLNFLDRLHYTELLRPLEFVQVAPPGFLMAEFAAFRHLGTSEYALRIFPLVSGLIALGLIARLAWLALPPVGAAAAMGIFGASQYITRYSLDIKPYGTDLMFAALLLVLTVQWLRRPEQMRWLVLLILAVPVAIASSFPAIFVAGAIVPPVVFALRAMRGPSRGNWGWVLLSIYSLVTILTFLLILHLSASDQYQQHRVEMLKYWKRGIPPLQPLRLLWWLLDVHTAEMFAYPFGGKLFGSTLTTLLCAIGIYSLYYRGQRQLLLLLGGAFLLTFIAALLRRYPYGGSARVAQHLAPAVCLFAGAAIDAIVASRQAAGARRTTIFIFAFLLLVAVGGIARDCSHPYQEMTDKRIQLLARHWNNLRGNDAGLLILGDVHHIPGCIRWYFSIGLRDREQACIYVSPADVTPNMLTGRPEWGVLSFDRKTNLDNLRIVVSPPQHPLQCIDDSTVKLDVADTDLGSFTRLQHWRGSAGLRN